MEEEEEEEDVGWKMGSGGVQCSTVSMLQQAVSEASHKHSQTLSPRLPQETGNK